MSDLLPFTLDNLAGAATRTLLAPLTESGTETPPLPVKLSDVFHQQSPYAAVSPYFDVGATGGPTQVGRNVALSGYTIEQSLTPLLEEPTEITYTVSVPFAELSPQTLSVVYQGTTTSVAITPLTGTTTDLAAQKTAFGNFFDLNHYRVVFVVRRSKKQGLVTEAGGTPPRTRGRFLAFVGYDCTMQAENAQSSFAKGTLAQFPMTFRLYPDDAMTTEGEEHGFWLDEQSGTFAA